MPRILPCRKGERQCRYWLCVNWWNHAGRPFRDWLGYW